MTRNLIERLEALETGREIDAEVAVAIGGWTKPRRHPGMLSPPGNPSECSYGWPAYTTSLDAAIALCERVRPGWTIARLGQDDYKQWHCELREGHQTSYNRVVIVMKFATPAAALLAALLRSVEKGGE
jgi:hypothetical protein